MGYWNKERELSTQLDSQFKPLTREQKFIVYDRLKRHYKLPQVLVLGPEPRHGHSGFCNRWKITLKTDKMSTLIHEVAHAIQFKQRYYGATEKFHVNKHLSIMRRVAKVVSTHLNDWLRVAEQKAERKAISMENKAIKKQQIEALKKTIDYKLTHAQALRQKWITKKGRAERAIKKLDRCIKLYQTKERAQTQDLNNNLAIGVLDGSQTNGSHT